MRCVPTVNVETACAHTAVMLGSGVSCTCVSAGTMRSKIPLVKWAQREDKLFITIEVTDVTDEKIELKPEGVLTFSGKGGPDKVCIRRKSAHAIAGPPLAAYAVSVISDVVDCVCHARSDHSLTGP